MTKYADASSAIVTLEERDHELFFTVRDDGRGFNATTTPRGSGTQNMSDRIEALGGSLHLTSTPGEGTTVSGTIPVQTREPVG